MEHGYKITLTNVPQTPAARQLHRYLDAHGIKLPTVLTNSNHAEVRSIFRAIAYHINFDAALGKNRTRRFLRILTAIEHKCDALRREVLRSFEETGERTGSGVARC